MTINLACRTLAAVAATATVLVLNTSFASAETNDSTAATDIAHPIQLQWINHLSFLSGDPSVHTSFNAVQSGGLVVRSTTTGDTATGGGNKVVERALEVPPGYHVKGVRVCYVGNDSAHSFITQIRLAQLQNPPSSSIVKLDDGTHLTATGPICVNSAMTDVNPALGSVALSFRVNFGSTRDNINILAVGLWVQN